MRQNKIEWDYLKGLATLLVIVGLSIIAVFIISLNHDHDAAFSGGIDVAKSAQVGDFVGGLVGSLWALAGVLLFYSALAMQRKEFRLQREEFALQRRELQNQKTEFFVTRVTNTIYRQIEIIDEAASKVRLEYHQESYIAEEVFDLVASYEFKGEQVKSDFFQKFSQDNATLAHVRSVTKSMEICSGLIDQRKPKAEQKVGEVVLILDDPTRHSLFNLLAANLDAYKLCDYFEKLEKIHEVLWREEGKPGLGRFHLDQIIEGRKLVIRSTSPGTATPLKEPPD